MPGKLPYKTYSSFLEERFPWKMQKISVNIGLSCPNRDGTIGKGGCIYCSNHAFVPEYCLSNNSIINQIILGKKFFGVKYPDMRYLAYFQAYTSTNSSDINKLINVFEQTMAIEDIEGIIISTRPDCIDTLFIQKLKVLADASNKRIMFEIGVESADDSTLKIINRGHSWNQTVEAINLIAENNFDVGAHLIMGLPGEDRNTMLRTVEETCSLPITSIKLHQLQIIKDTVLHKKWIEKEIELKLFTLDDYLKLCCDIVTIVPPHIAIERFTASSPANMLIAPKWGIKNYQFVNKLNNLLYY